ncbi:MAG: CRTAC1 family protein [Verrucomicrobiales bacterium]|nr:CRTAC1 family protein [Verrucomicrobiales bacterium]
MKPPDPSRPIPSGKRIRFLLVLGVVLAAWASTWLWPRSSPTRPARSQAPARASEDDAATAALPDRVIQEFVAIEAREAEIDQTLFARDRLAREHGAVMEAVWDALNAVPDPLALLASAPLQSLQWTPPVPAAPLPHGLTRWHSPSTPVEPWPDWRDRILAARHAGWKLVQSEWRHVDFTPSSGTSPAHSTFEVSLHLTRTTPEERLQIQARLRLAWPGSPTLDGATASLAELEVSHRSGPPPFHPAAALEVAPFPKTTWIDPILLHDLDADGTPEILLVARNAVLARQPDGSWQTLRLSAHHPGLLFTAVLGDFTGDARADLLIAVRSGLLLLPGGPTGAFDQPARAVWLAPEKLRYAQALTSGDIDGDGDLDVFLAQYRPPYVEGQMPRPYYDARDGPPSYLLVNRGEGTFDDATLGSGLEPFRHRRTYSASFVDLDHDADLDLLVVSDFAGLDLHANLGRGRFENRTASWVDDPRGLGMAHALADVDANGAFDLIMMGMPQPTAERLTAAGLERPEFAAWASERPRVSFGNRLFFKDGTTYRQRPGRPPIARAGWAWGVTDADLDLDRFPDLHIVNGHETRASVRDFESEFWTHDLYVGDSTPRAAVDAYFAAKFARTRSLGWSYGGYDKNRLYLNREGHEFVEVGHLFGVALQEDCRNALAADLDQDGDQDLIVTTFEIWPTTKQTIRIFENRLPRTGHWLGVRLVQGPRGAAPAGATVTLTDSLGRQQRPWVTGNRFRSQDLDVVHFGLGATARPLQVEVRWADGRSTTLEAPEPDRIHDLVSPPR